ncbi:hypothetical protein [Streptomyces sp. NBC_00539]|uniref:hypothetical protein n=1 Tax=Streptomyces sp. NBC_00539 TaxID=2975770 RepID=UPI002E7FEF62|nr:hypothetical protein [Streptomyces sp. NBC_00539]WUC62781.1 hypothetical protein OG861_00270 [Streptomyces sp. NBC_00539]
MTSPARMTRIALSPAEAHELDELTRTVEDCATALEQARAALGNAAGRIAASYERGGPAAVAAQVGWSRQHVSTLAADHRREQHEQVDAA